MKSKVLFESKYYVACLLKIGLIIQNKRTWDGKLMGKDHPQFKDWINSFNDLLDKNEGNRLCHYFCCD